MRQEQFIESQGRIIDLTHAQAYALSQAGRRLASSKEWWGSSSSNAEDRSVIRCDLQSDNRWKVVVTDAIGIISIGDLHIEVHPKIPLNHVLFLFGESGHFPRMDSQYVGASVGTSLWELIAKWFLIEAERVLRSDLLKDYEEISEWLAVIRGRVDVPRTVVATARGRLEALCETEDFTTNMPLNRIIREAARCIGADVNLSWFDRRRALSIHSRLGGSGSLRPGDLAVSVDRRSAHYRSAALLARHIILALGRSIEIGAQEAWTFLIRTPEMIEAGLRKIIQTLLGDCWTVAKQGKQLPGSSVTVNPDLVINAGYAVGDIKYKRLGSDWNRDDLYQITAFAVAFETPRAALVGFNADPEERLSGISIGPIRIHRLTWPATADWTPRRSADHLATQLNNWLLE